MSKPVKKPNDNLWVCHECELIGDAAAATRHVELTGHPVEEQSAEISEQLRALWREELRSQKDGAPLVGPVMVVDPRRLVAW